MPLLEVKTIQDIAPTMGAQHPAEPAVHRISDAKSAYNIWLQMMTSQQGQSIFRSLVKGLLDGNRPNNDAEQRRKGRGWESNVNFGEARSIRDQRVLSYWKLVNDVPFLAMFYDRQNYQQLGTEDIDRTEAENIVSEEFTNMIRLWDDWQSEMIQNLEEFVSYGTGPVIFPDHGWQFKSMLSGNVLVPLYAKTSTGKLELMMIRDSKPPHELFELISSENDKRQSELVGWKPDRVSEALKFACRSVWKEDSTQTSIFESYLMRSKANDLVMTSQIPTIRIVHVLVREVAEPQRVSHYILFEDINLDDFLYVREQTYDSISEMVHMLFYDNGGGYWRNVKGLGHRIYNHQELSNRTLNHTVNASTLAGSLILKMTGESAESFAATRIGPFMLVPRNFEPMQQSFAPNLQAMTGLRSLLQNVLQSNEGVYSQDKELPEGKTPRSSAEWRIRAMNDSTIKDNQMETFYNQMDQRYRMMFKRLFDPKLTGNMPGAKEAKTFLQRCRERGVPEDMLKPDRFIIFASRAIGNGSPVMRDGILQDLIGVSSSLPERGRWNAIRDFVAGKVGYHMVNRYIQPYKLESNQDEHSSIAQLENIAMKDGETPLVAANQPHIVHAMQHLVLLDSMAQSYQQQDPNFDVVKFGHAAMLCVDHLMQHLQFLYADTSRQKALKTILDHLKQLMPIIQQIRKESDKARQEHQQQQQAQAEQQGAGLSADQKIQIQKIHGDLKIKAAKEMAGEQMKWKKLEADIARKDKMVDATISLNERKALGQASMTSPIPQVPMPGPQLPQPGVRP